MNIAVLAESLQGRVLTRETDNWLTATNSARFDDVQPIATAHCESPADVARTLAFIRQHGLETATRCGGHCFAGRSSTPGLLIDVSALRSISVSNGLVKVGAGARLGEVYGSLLESQLTIPAGTCPSVGIAGLTLGGGLGMLGRTQGITSDHLVRAEIVLADGRVVECDENHDADLFWALRGAGAGNFGVVTALVFKPLPVPPLVTTFNVTWPRKAAAPVLEAWLAWLDEAPDEIAASLDLRVSGNLGEPATVELFGAMLGVRSDTIAAIDRLVARCSDPRTFSVREGSYRDALRYWAERAGERLQEPRAGSGIRSYELIKSEFFNRALPSDAVTALLDNFDAGRITGEMRNIDFSPWGGAYNRVHPHASAFVHRNARYWIKHTSALDTGASHDEQEAAKRWVQRSWQVVTDWGTGGVFPNFPDPDLGGWGEAYYGSNYERLLQVKARYDPGDLFRFTQSLPVSAH